MFIDVVFLFLIIAAIIKGYSKGLIVAMFSFFAVIIGIVLAIKLSANVAHWLQSSTNIAGFWLPFLSFALVIIAVVFVVKIVAKIIESTVEFALLGWANKLGGILMYAALYTSLLSVILFYFTKMNIIKPETLTASKTYPFIQPWAVNVIAVFSKLLPFFKDALIQLEAFFKTKI